MPSMGPTHTGIGPRGGRRSGWGMTGFSTMGPAISVREFRHRIRALKAGVRNKAREILYAAGEPLRDQWKDNIAAEGWGPSGGAHEGLTGAQKMFRLQPKETTSGSTGRYYDSIVIQVTDDLEVEVGSTIPRPSGRGLHTWSYPEALEYGTATAQAYPTLRPAYDEAGPRMESKAKEVFDALVIGYMSGKYRA